MINSIQRLKKYWTQRTALLHTRSNRYSVGLTIGGLDSRCSTSVRVHDEGELCRNSNVTEGIEDSSMGDTPEGISDI